MLQSFNQSLCHTIAPRPLGSNFIDALSHSFYTIGQTLLPIHLHFQSTHDYELQINKLFHPQKNLQPSLFHDQLQPQQHILGFVIGLKNNYCQLLLCL
jgi:hypothetical protein